MTALTEMQFKQEANLSSQIAHPVQNSYSSLLAQFKALMSKRNRNGRVPKRGRLGVCVVCRTKQRVPSCTLCLQHALAACAITPGNTSFMHAQVYHKMMCTRIPATGVNCPHELSPLAMRHLVVEANVAQALLNACVEQKNVVLFEVFVKLYLEHVVLIEDVTDSGYTIPYKNATLTQDLVEYALAALYLLYQN